MNNDVKLNGNIKASYILLIDENGVKQGIVQTTKALAQARALSLDLVQVSNKTEANINPVCKIMDYGKILYHKHKSEKESKTVSNIMKEIRISMNIGDHDLEIKNKKVLEFLNKGFKVRYVAQLKGVRGNNTDVLSYLNELLNKYFINVATWDLPSSNGKNVSVTMSKK
jgi:translation initiation factor IF-3